MNKLDLTGQRFGRLTVLEPAGVNAWGLRSWRCRCDCGREHVVLGSVLRSGSTQSCGCLRKEQVSARRRKHGHAGDTRRGKAQSPEYAAWASAKQRCYNPKANGYAVYGGRGIQMCERWRESFENFLADMGPRPSPEHSLDRFPNNDGDYNPSNTRWATAKEQGNNTRKNVLMPAGETLMQYVERTAGRRDMALYHRLRKQLRTG